MTDNARFITLVTVFEALTPKSDISKIAIDSLEKVKECLKEIKKQYKPNSKNREDIEHLISRVGNLKEQAITTRIRKFVEEKVQNYDLGDPTEISDKIKKIYKCRSTLLHNGKVEPAQIEDYLKFLKDFVPKLLEAMYLSSVSK